MSAAQVTEAHRELAYAILFATEDGHAGPNETAQLIADSEARARCEIAMVAAESADRNVSLRLQNAELRAVFPRILAALGNGACCAPDVSVEFIESIPNEVAGVVAQLRAEVAWWKNWHDENEKMEDGIAVKVQATIDRLRAEVERLKAKISNQAYRIRCLEGATNHATGTPLSQAIARAERAEAELAFQVARNSDLFTQRDQIRAELDAERARLADLVADLNDACITLESAKNDCDDYAMQNTAFKLMAVRAVLLQYIPVAAMKEETK